MAKTKAKQVNVGPMIESVEKKTNSLTVVKMVMVKEPRYRMVPVDLVTHKQLMALCELRGFGQRGQGALVRSLIKKEYKAEKGKLKK